MVRLNEKISIVTPTYNEEENIELLIKKEGNQNFPS